MSGLFFLFSYNEIAHFQHLIFLCFAFAFISINHWMPFLVSSLQERYCNCNEIRFLIQIKYQSKTIHWTNSFSCEHFKRLSKKAHTLYPIQSHTFSHREGGVNLYWLSAHWFDTNHILKIVHARVCSTAWNKKTPEKCVSYFMTYLQ